MAKWADYCISAVSYNNSKKTHIEKVKVHEDKEKTIGTSSEWSRTKVVSTIEKGKTFVTIFKKADGWNKGEDVRIVKINGTKYIRTDSNKTASDNLRNLPEF